MRYYAPSYFLYQRIFQLARGYKPVAVMVLLQRGNGLAGQLNIVSGVMDQHPHINLGAVMLQHKG